MPKKCWNCGAENPTHHFDICEHEKVSEETGAFFKIDMHQREYCENCFKAVSEKYWENRKEYVRLKSVLMFERAVRILEKQSIEIYDYQEAIKAVEEYVLEYPEKFQSAHEIIVAIIFVDNEIEVTTQFKVGKYKVDFYVPKLKMILEVDGYMHEFREHADNRRDNEIRSILGKDWETVRIPTKYIEQNAELLVEAARSLKAEMQKLRKENFGALPEWYSKRTKKSRKTKRDF